MRALVALLVGLCNAAEAVASLAAARAAHVEAHAKQCAAAAALYRPPTGAASTRAALAPPRTTRFETGGGGGDGDAPVGVVCTEPIFSAAECAAVIAEAEATALAAGGWSTTRHARHPAADVSLELLPRAREWFAAELAGVVAPLLSGWFPQLLPDSTALRVADAFVVRYKWESGQIELPVHRDGSLLTVNVALNGDRGDFEGGGTWVEHCDARVLAPAGALLAHASAARHAGAPISRGVRYILVAFCISADDVEHGRRFLERGVALAAAGRLEEAREALERALAEDGRLQAAHLNLGNVLREQGRERDAAAAYRAALRLCGGAEASRYGEALLGLSSVSEDAAEAAALARRALLADGRSCAACLALAAALCRAPDGGGASGAKLRADALAAYAEAEARASPGAQLADVHHQRGRALFGAGDLRGARGAFEKSICEDDYGARAHADLAVCLYELGDEAGALEAFERALALDPSDASVRAQAEEVAAYLGATLRGGATNGPRRRGGGGGGGGGEGGGFGAAPPAGGRAARGGSGFGGKGRAK